MTDELLDIVAQHCRATNANGERCRAPEHMVMDGYCHAHRPGGADAMRERAMLGGAATRARFGGRAFIAEELPPLKTLEGAKDALDEIRVAVMTRRLTHAEGNAASKAVAEWVKAEGAALTGRLVNELRADLDAKAAEIADLRKQLGGGLHPRRTP